MQKSMLFSLPPAIDAVKRPDATAWRESFEGAGIGTRADWNNVRVDAGRDKLNLHAGNPDASNFLEANLDAIAGCIAETMSKPVPFEIGERTVGVRAGTDRLWAYRIARLVSEKKGDFKPHLEIPLSQELRDRLARKIENSIVRELTFWGRLPDVLSDGAPFIAVSDPGRAMIIPAIESGRSGHAKKVSVLVRRDVFFLSYWRLEGRLYAGSLNALGYGRIDRAAAPEMLSVEMQRQLLKIAPESSESMA